MDAQALAEAARDAMWSTDKASQAAGMRVVAVAPGQATLEMRVRDDMVNGHGICHGGYLFLLADSTFAFACNSHNQKAVAQQCAITFLKPAFEHELLTATATELAQQGRSGIYDIAVRNDAGEVVAQFRGHSRTIKGQHVETTA
ncbi:MAG: hydroxyphenylacetyl-CoA thioesterase PaaI [Pseudomonadota bacterium]